MLNLSVYLASRTEEENQLLKRKLDPLKREFNQVRFIGLHPQGLALSASEKMAVVVMNVSEWNKNEMACLLSLRTAGYRGPILVMARVKVSKALESLRLMDNVLLLEKPFENKDLLGIVRKMLNARAVAQQVHRRFHTDEVAEIVPFGKDDAYETKLFNISKGGAYLEFEAYAPVRIGDMVRVKVELKAVNRVYTVPARVVWTGKAAGRSATGAGVQFVGTPDVQKSLIGSI